MSAMNDTHGHIELIIGPMFAGKTTELMRRVRRELFARRSCYIIKHARDNRYNRESVSSHDNMLLGATAAVSQLSEVGEAWRSYDVVAVDEGQFFPDVCSFCTTVADAGKTVIVSALDGDYRRQPFANICQLIPLTESVKKLSAVCMACHSRAASFTYRTIASQQRELIGGADMYIATCRACFIAKEKEREAREAEEELTTQEHNNNNIINKNNNKNNSGEENIAATPETHAVLETEDSPSPAAVAGAVGRKRLLSPSSNAVDNNNNNNSNIDNNNKDNNNNIEKPDDDDNENSNSERRGVKPRVECH